MVGQLVQANMLLGRVRISMASMEHTATLPRSSGMACGAAVGALGRMNGELQMSQHVPVLKLLTPRSTLVCRAVYGASVARNVAPLSLKQTPQASEGAEGVSFEVEV